METSKFIKDDYYSSYWNIFDYLLLDYTKDNKIVKAIKELNDLDYKESNIVTALYRKKPYFDTIKKQENFADILKDMVIEYYKTHEKK